MFFVAGITGRVGGAAARHLLDQGHAVRALVRDPSKATEWSAKGVDVRQGDLSSAGALAAALDGVQGAFVMQPTPMVVESGFALARAITSGVRDARDRSPPPLLVMLSSVGSEKKSGWGTSRRRICSKRRSTTWSSQARLCALAPL